ncbi:MAG TPA: BppU family phage baseplate upper protein [Feifaniaceae bacterium]|nr:BppU family phage baseplate upper protein [Feifaniaceae bacterium]
MQTKDYSVVLDMMRTLPFRPFEVVEGDTGNVLHVTLLNNGDAMDLTGCKLCVIFASSSGFAMQDETSGITKSAESGAFDISLLPTAYGAGNVSADVQIYSGEDDKTLITSTRFDFRCRKSLVSGEIIRANTAYPPLIEAARAANEAASAALAAAERIGNDIGEMNVQADWSVTDDGSDAFIRNKPAIPATPGAVGAAAATHAAQHGPNGTDPVTPIAHASRHASGGADALSPSAIGAAALSDGKVSPEQASATISTYTANHALELSDAGRLILMNLSSAGTLTIPANASVAFPVGAELEVCQYGAGAVTIAAASGVTLVSLDSAVLFAGQYACAALKQVAADVWLLAGGVA